MDSDNAELIARQLENHPDFRVLRRLKATDTFADHLGRKTAIGIIADTETTGLNSATDKVIELCLLRFEYDVESGDVCRVLDVYDAFQDPGVPIPEEVVELTGITQEMVAGQKIDNDRVATMLADASVVVCHNAKFDRPFLEALSPLFETLNFACSLNEIDWSKEGVGSTKLSFIASTYGFFYDAHRAEADCRALLNILAKPLPVSGKTGLSTLIEKLQKLVYTLHATNSPFSSKDALKARKYRWDSELKVWHIEVTSRAELNAEVTWLRDNVFSSDGAVLDLEGRDAKTRFSSRPGNQLKRPIAAILA